MQNGGTELLRPLPAGQGGWGLNKARLGSYRLDVPIWSPGYQHCWQLCVDRFPPSFSFSIVNVQNENQKQALGQVISYDCQQ